MDKLLRTLQAYFPFLLEAKFAVRSFVSRALKRPHDPDFRALALFSAITDSTDIVPPAGGAPAEAGPALYLDVGANRGQSIQDILMFTRRSCIWSFEPNPLLCDKLERRYHKQPRVVIKDFGLGDQDGAFKLYVPYYKQWMYDGLASLKREAAADWLKDRVYRYQPEHLTIKEVDCRIRRLDDLVLPIGGELAPFFIKLDVQGYELEALRGGERTLRSHQPILLIESPDEETCRFLSAMGYQPYSFADGQLKAGALGVTNTFFMTEGKASLLRTLPRQEPCPGQAA